MIPLEALATSLECSREERVQASRIQCPKPSGRGMRLWGKSVPKTPWLPVACATGSGLEFSLQTISAAGDVAPSSPSALFLVVVGAVVVSSWRRPESMSKSRKWYTQNAQKINTAPAITMLVKYIIATYNNYVRKVLARLHRQNSPWHLRSKRVLVI